jgi:hypothetical protein
VHSLARAETKLGILVADADHYARHACERRRVELRLKVDRHALLPENHLGVPADRADGEVGCW